ncbi:zinc D-Ala-D-Ala carboxypeptidase [Podospora fimiseda]|uniref:Zinc D-Ala-D-Ala carboxypeptidase n=1 Tax=Podospora fimiseda TaxID=252190 RepID=A0AAN7BJ49_9PEZI|nr:zinc D-Ala-D-Ala carboxypeptidase [Podospora fimiseda]
MKPTTLFSSLILLFSSANPITAHPTTSPSSTTDALLSPRADRYCDTSYVRHVAPNSRRINYTSLSSGGSCIMGVGAKGSSVKSVQEAINKCYGGSFDTDGKYGELTKKAVKKMQKKIGVPQDGIWGTNTGGKMHFYGARLARPDRPDLGDVHGCVSL